MTGAQPQREMSPGGMADQHDAIQVEWVGLRQRAQVLSASRDVLERTRPGATWIAYAAVLQVPGGDAATRKLITQMRDVIQVVLRLPAPSVQDDGNRMRSLALGQAEVAELLGTGPISNALAGRGSRQGDDVGPGRRCAWAAGKGATGSKPGNEEGGSANVDRSQAGAPFCADYILGED